MTLLDGMMSMSGTRMMPSVQQIIRVAIRPALLELQVAEDAGLHVDPQAETLADAVGDPC
jgi:hypothetical protein